MATNTSKFVCIECGEQIVNKLFICTLNHTFCHICKAKFGNCYLCERKIETERKKFLFNPSVNSTGLTEVHKKVTIKISITQENSNNKNDNSDSFDLEENPEIGRTSPDLQDQDAASSSYGLDSCVRRSILAGSMVEKTGSFLSCSEKSSGGEFEDSGCGSNPWASSTFNHGTSPPSPMLTPERGVFGNIPLEDYNTPKAGIFENSPTTEEESPLKRPGQKPSDALTHFRVIQSALGKPSKPFKKVQIMKTAISRTVIKSIPCPMPDCKTRCKNFHQLLLHLNNMHVHSYTVLNTIQHTSIPIHPGVVGFYSSSKIVKIWDKFFAIECLVCYKEKKCFIHAGIVGEGQSYKSFGFRLCEGGSWKNVATHPCQKFARNGLGAAIGGVSKICVYFFKIK